MKVTYDESNSEQYHPDFHPNHGLPFTKDDLIYLCKFYEIDGMKRMALAIGKTEKVVSNKVADLKKKGIYEVYKNMPIEQWESIIGGINL